MLRFWRLSLQDLPIRILETIGAHLPAQSYLNLRESCRATAKLDKIAKLNFKAFLDSMQGWRDNKTGKYYWKLYNFLNIYVRKRSKTYTGKRLRVSPKDQCFLENVRLKVSEYSPSVFVWMCKKQVGDEVVRMIRNDPFVLDAIPSNSSYKAFILTWASFYSHFDIIKLLLQDPRVDPSADHNITIRWASKMGQADLVAMLLQDERVDPSAKDDFAICHASGNGHMEVVELLLKDRRVNPAARDNSAIRHASGNGHQEIVRLLVQDDRVDLLVAMLFF